MQISHTVAGCEQLLFVGDLLKTLSYCHLTVFANIGVIAHRLFFFALDQCLNDAYLRAKRFLTFDFLPFDMKLNIKHLNIHLVKSGWATKQI